MVINNCELNPFYCSPFAKDGAKINKISGKIVPVLILLGIGMNLFFVGVLNLLSFIPGLTEIMQDYLFKSL